MKPKFFLLLLLSIAIIPSCKNNQKASEETPSTFKTLEITRSDAAIKAVYAATLEGQQLVEIRPQVSGTITSIDFNEGDKVKKGQVLFVIDQVPYQAALEVAEANVNNAQAQLATAQLTYDSNKELFDNEVISAYELQMTENKLSERKAALAQAEAQLTTASNNLSYTLVKSPVTGVAGMIPYRVGALVSSGISDPLVTVSDDSFINAYFSLSENMTIDLMQQYGSQEAFIKGMPQVSLVLGNGREYTHKGHIDAVSGIVDKSTGAVRMRARFENPDHLLRSGGNANVIIPTEVKGCIQIPQAATYEIQERVFVFKVVDGKAVSTRVEVFKYNDGNNYIVESGLQEGDIIIAEGAGLVKEGTTVKTQQE